jgi:hypothetical protein
MAEATLNDNDAGLAQARFPEPDAHGQAALLLTESLLHSLIARDVITLKDAIEVVEVAEEVQEVIAEDFSDPPATMERSLALLASIRLSLRNDLIP